MSWRAKEKEKRRLKRLYGTGWSYWGPVYRNDRRGGYLCRAYPYSTNHGNNKKWWVKHSNRRFRRRKNEWDDILQRSQHKKTFDLWWTLL